MYLLLHNLHDCTFNSVSKLILVDTDKKLLWNMNVSNEVTLPI